MAAGPDSDSSTPELSIIVVNWNTREMTLECLRSVYAQTLETRFELLLVDNGSADGSAEAIAAEFPQVRLFAEDTNHGFGVANNLAAREARGKRLLLLNTDTVVLDRAIDRLVKFADERPTAGIWGGRTLAGDGTLDIGSCWRAQTLWSVVCFAFGLTMLFPRSELFNPEGMGAWRRDSVREVDIVSGCFLLIDGDLWRRLEGFDPKFFMYGEEADMCARARAIGARPVITPDATIVHYGGASAVRRSDFYVRLFRGKIVLAKRSMNAVSALAVCWLYLLAAIVRAAGYRLRARLTGKSPELAESWQQTLQRRGEWME